MENDSVLRVGLVGCGRHGTALARAAVQCAALSLAACADPDEAAASRAAALSPGASTHASVEALLAECEVDAIVIATPHHLLAPIAQANMFWQKSHWRSTTGNWPKSRVWWPKRGSVTWQGTPSVT